MLFDHFLFLFNVRFFLFLVFVFGILANVLLCDVGGLSKIRGLDDGVCTYGMGWCVNFGGG